MDLTIEFTSHENIDWLRRIAKAIETADRQEKGQHVRLILPKQSTAIKAQPLHLVSLACLIEYLERQKHQVIITSDNNIQDERFSNDIFKLWHISEGEKDLYAKNVELYFKNKYFAGKDVSVISYSMIEAFYNIFDHAEADNNAFSMIEFDEEDMRLCVAVCDFGKGIAQSVRDYEPTIASDSEALLKAINVDFTAGTKRHNKGKGLDNILSCADMATIFCNNAMLQKSGQAIKTLEVDFRFNGTLIYFEVVLVDLEDERDILNEFTF
jgi:anti-sigma regulatory factor (Ser/Thr protein kinase)